MSGAAVVYLLCLLTAVVCAVLLARAWLASRSRLLLYSAACFALLALNNLLVVTDMVLLPVEPDLTVWRQLTVVAALGVLLYGFIWEAE